MLFLSQDLPAPSFEGALLVPEKPGAAHSVGLNSIRLVYLCLKF